MAENSDREMSPTLQSPDQPRSKEARYLPCPTRFENAWSREGRCLAGCAKPPGLWPSGRVRDTSYCHLARWSENGKQRYWQSPARNYDWLYLCQSLELPCADEPPRLGRAAGRVGLDPDRDCDCWSGSASTNSCRGSVGLGWIQIGIVIAGAVARPPITIPIWRWEE